MIKVEDFQAEAMALDALVDAFAKDMKVKLRKKYKRDGYSGWDDPDYTDNLKDGLSDHLYKRDGREHVDWVDIGNFAAFLWNLKDAPC